MPVRYFLPGFRIGTDICHLARIRSLLRRGPPLLPSSSKPHPFLAKLLTPREASHFKARTKPTELPTGLSGRDIEIEEDRTVKYLAGRWAAKEAVIKAIKPRKVLLREIEIWTDRDNDYFALIMDSPAPTFHYEDYVDDIHPDLQDFVMSHGPLALNEVLGAHVHGQLSPVSISHDGEYATAVAVGLPNA